MDVEQILTFFDREQRREVHFSDARREVTPTVVRQIGLYRPESAIIYSWLTPDNVETVISEELAYFEWLRHHLEWKVYSHDQPADLKDRLLARGFEVEEAETLLVIDLDAAPPNLLQPITLDVRRITQPDKLDDVAVVYKQVWDEDFKPLIERLARDLQQRPNQIDVYVAYVDETPASIAWICFHRNSQFASLWGGSTAPAYRKRGLYSALLAARAQEAQRRGIRFLTVDATPMSRPILETSGFQWLSTIYPCKWRPRR